MIEPRIARSGDIGGGLWPLRTRVQPLAKGGDLRGREPIAFGRHAFVFVVAGDPAEDRAFRAFASHDHRPVVATFHGVRFRVETQASLLFLRAVAFHAALPEHGVEILFKINGSRGGDASEKSDEPPVHAHISWMTRPCTSVRRRLIPLW